MLRSIWSALRGSTPSLNATSTVSSKLRLASDFTRSNAWAGSCSSVLSYFLAASTYFLPCAMLRSFRKLPRVSPGSTAEVVPSGRVPSSCQSTTSMPMERAVPATCAIAPSMSIALTSGILVCGDLPDLGLGDLRDRLAPGRGRALLDPRGLAQQDRSGRGLGDEGERAILVDRDLGRDHRAALRLRRGVVRLAEVHDVDAVRTERGPDRRRGSGRAGVDLNSSRSLLRVASP